MTLQAYEWKDGLLHLQLIVNDVEKAWLCAKDMEGLLTQMSRDATVSHTNGIPGHEGATYTTVQSLAHRGKYAPNKVVTTTYSLTEINNYDKIIRYSASRSQNAATPELFEVTIHVGAIGPTGEKIVKITTSQKQPKIPLRVLICVGIPIFCLPFLVMTAVKSATKKAMNALVDNLQNHFNNYIPKEEGTAHDVGPDIGDSVIPTAS